MQWSEIQSAKVVTPEQDLYLRALPRLDVDDPEAVCAFVREHGWVVVPGWFRQDMLWY